MMGPDIHGKALALLAATETAFLAAGITLPDRRYVADGTVAWDCDLLAVQVVTVGNGPPGPAAFPVVLNDAVQWAAELAVHSVRCSPSMGTRGQAPTGATISASAATIQADGSAMLDAAMAFVGACHDVVLLGLTFPGPEGAYVGALMRLSVAIT